MRHGPEDLSWRDARAFCEEHEMLLPMPIRSSQNDLFKTVGPTWLSLNLNDVINGKIFKMCNTKFALHDDFDERHWHSIFQY